MIPHRRLLLIALVCFGLGIAILSLAGCAPFALSRRDRAGDVA